MSERLGNNNGFVLMSILLLLPMLMALAASALPEIAARQQFRIAHKVAQDIIEILNAGKNYYAANNDWPKKVTIDGTDAITELQESGYLPPEWDGTSFSEQYMYVTYIVTSPGGAYSEYDHFAVGTPVPSNDVAKYLVRILPNGTYEEDKNILWGAVPPPGLGAAYDDIRRYADEKFNRIVEEWVPENIKVECITEEITVNWNDRYKPFYTTVAPGTVENFVKTGHVKIKVGTTKEYDLGLTFPTQGPTWNTNWLYNWTEYDIGTVRYGTKTIKMRDNERPTTFD